MPREDIGPRRCLPGEPQSVGAAAGQGARPYPDDWPPGCPPSDALPANGNVYRIVKHSPPTADDFRSHRDLGKLPDANPCLRCGLSVFRTIEGAMHARKLFRRLGRFIAHGSLAPEHGTLKPTSGRVPNHLTWWAYLEVDRAAPFSILHAQTDVTEEIA